MKIRKPKNYLPITLSLLTFVMVAIFGGSFLTLDIKDSNIRRSSASTLEPADINNDNNVNIFDLSTLLSNWNNTGVNTSDVNSDSVVNIFDLSMLLSRWGSVAIATPTPTLTPTPSQNTNCASVPSACGYPDGTNTGPAAGTVFRRVPQDVSSGPGWQWNASDPSIRIFGSNAVLDGLIINAQVVIDAPNARLSNSIVTYCNLEGDIVAVRGSDNGDYNGHNATIRNNRLTCNQPTTNRARSGVRDIYGAAQNITVIANEISGTGNGVTVEYEGVVSDNWVHDLGHVPTDHHSGLSNHGGAKSVVFSHNTLLLANTSTVGGGGLSGAITSYGDFAHAQNITSRDNFLSGGAYTVYGGINNEATYGNPTNIKFINNRYVCGSWIYGPAFLRSGTGNEFTGNYCDSNLSVVSS